MSELIPKPVVNSSGAAAFRRAVDVVYWIGAVIGCSALVLVSAVIPWAVYTRYVMNSAASWPEPMAVLLTVGMTFIGAANCYRQRIHMNMTIGTDLFEITGDPRRRRHRDAGAHQRVR